MIMKTNTQTFCRTVCLSATLLIAAGLANGKLIAQEVRCDPTKVMTAASCEKCHLNEVKRWKNTPHFQTFEQLSRRPEAKQICSNLGLRSVKRSDVCIKCHYTLKDMGGKLKTVSGVSCESCHGASKDWLPLHNDYGGPTATKESESPEHAIERFMRSTENGMRNTRNLYAIASSCLNCHTVPNERLVNVGGHKAGTDEFELVRYSQGKVRHNFLRNKGETNTVSAPDRLRIMFVVGKIAELEYATRATAQATAKSRYGTSVANRAARTAVKLYELQQKINDPNLQLALQAFAGADLKINNKESLLVIADQIRAAGESFSEQADGANFASIDDQLPDPSTYK